MKNLSKLGRGMLWAAVTSTAIVGCVTGEPDDDPLTDDSVATAPVGAPPLASPADDVVADWTPFRENGRYYILRNDGTKVPLLEPTETDVPAVTTADIDTRPMLTPPSYDLSAWQTPVKNQLDRGSCGTFATVAAIEAQYKRTWGMTLDLSEQYMFHVTKSTGYNYPRIYQYENQSSYWYGGGWPTAQYMLPLETDAPYAGYTGCESPGACTPLNSIPGASDLVWAADPAANHVTQKQVDDFEYSPLHIPPAARNKARYGVATWTNYNWVDSRNTTLLETLIASNKEVVFSTVTKWKMLPNGVLDYDSTVAGGGHVVLLIGYDRAGGYFLAKNSWGGTAPSAYLKLSYNFIRNTGGGAATVDSVVSPYSAPQAKAKWIGKWYSDHEGWHGTMVVRRITNPANAAERLGTYYANGSYSAGHSVNGYSVDGYRGLYYYVASETENAPGTLSGQPFHATQYDWEPTQAAVLVWWTGGEGGVHLTRSYYYVPYSSSFSVNEWLGTWDLDNNGNTGRLIISSLIGSGTSWTINGSLLMGGVYRSFTGTITTLAPATLHLTVDGVWHYTLHYHGWEDQLASGLVTRSGYATTGVHMLRR